MPTLSEINEEFLFGAEQIRYSYMSFGQEIWSNTLPSKASPHDISYYRSVKYKGKPIYMCVMDIDGDRMTDTSVGVAVELYHAAWNRFGVRPLLKASGKKGCQVIFDVGFPKEWSDQDCRSKLADIAYTLWNCSRVRKTFNVEFGLKRKGVYIDACMFTKGRVVRSFCRHLGSGKFSVPFHWKDTVPTIKRRMELQNESDLLEVIIPVTHIGVDTELEHWTPKSVFEHQDLSPELLAQLDNIDTRRAHAGRPDNIYEQLPLRLKKIVSMDADIRHSSKWPVVVYLYAELKLTPEQIVAWLFKNARWNDLNNISITSYQVNWSCQWAQKVIDEGGNPIPRWIYA